MPVRRIYAFAAVILLVILTLYVTSTRFVPYRYNLQDLLSYSTRPLWDKDEAPGWPIAHISTAGIATNDSNACLRHGWALTETSKARKIWDATLISTELDLLEIRLRELWDVVDVFLVMESTHTMTGLPKSTMHFAENRQRFQLFESKLRYVQHQGRERRTGDGAFTLANEIRSAMTETINRQPDVNDDNMLVIMADVDEIPSHQAIELIKACETPLPIHLQLDNFLYSFEYATLADSWRASLHSWRVARANRGYTHGKLTDHILTAAGWHCSFCFATLAEYKYKMMAASHVDRLLKRPNFKAYLSDESIQRRICEGKDLYDMPPEMYSWSDLIKYWNGARKTMGNTQLPIAVLEDWKRFRYLLPGQQCHRDAGKLDANIVPDKLVMRSNWAEV